MLYQIGQGHHHESQPDHSLSYDINSLGYTPDKLTTHMC